MDLETSVQKHPSAKIGTSHGVLRNFGPEPPPPKIGISHGGLRNFGPEYTSRPKPQDWNSS